MKTLTISKEGSLFTVDEPGRPGSPPVGRGRTMMEAFGNYLINNQAYLGLTIKVDTTADATEQRRRVRELAKR